VHGRAKGNWRQVYPIGAARGPVSTEVPSEIAKDYIEACNVLPISTKASAALSRRCLQNMLHAHAYKSKDLAKEIDLLLGETDPKRDCRTNGVRPLTGSAISVTSRRTR